MRQPTEKMLECAAEAGSLGNWIGERLDGLQISTDDRNRLAAACLHVSLTHHIAMATLVQAGAFASGFALLRPQIDAHLRGLWIRSIASDEEIQSVKDGHNAPNSQTIAQKLEEAGDFDTGTLTKVAHGIWPAACDFTHTGIRVIHAHLRNGEIDPAFSDAEVNDLFQVSNIWAVLAGIALFDMAGLGDAIVDLGLKGVEIAKGFAKPEGSA